MHMVPYPTPLTLRLICIQDSGNSNVIGKQINAVFLSGTDPQRVVQILEAGGYCP